MTTHQLDSGLPRVLRAAGALVAPGTALVALLYYFGWLHVFWFCNYFGVNSTVLGFTTEDYLMRNVDGLFVPLAVVATITLLVAWSRYLVSPVLARRPAARLLAAGIALVLGTAAATAGFLAVFGLRLGLAVGPLCLAAGVLLLALASRLQRTGGTTRVQWALLAEWAGIFAVVCICAFWAVADYASAVGTGRAQQVEAELAGYPGVTVHSAKSLGLAGPGIDRTPCPAPDGTYHYRYDGLKLVLQSGDQYFLLPRNWSRGTGQAIILPRGDGVRLEFSATPAGLRGLPCAG